MFYECKPITTAHATTVLLLLSAVLPTPAYGIDRPLQRAVLSFLLPQLQASYRYRPSRNTPSKHVIVTSDPSQLIQNSEALPFEINGTGQRNAYESVQQLQQGQQHAVRVGLLWKLDELLASKQHNAAVQLQHTRVKQHLAWLQHHNHILQHPRTSCPRTTLTQTLNCWAQRLEAKALQQGLSQTFHYSNNKK